MWLALVRNVGRSTIFLALFAGLVTARVARADTSTFVGPPRPFVGPPKPPIRAPHARFHLSREFLPGQDITIGQAHTTRRGFLSRLSAGAQQNARAVVAFPKASGFVGSKSGTDPKTLLIVTNYHVAGEGPPDGVITFADGTVAQAIRTIAADPKRDCALVRVRLVSGPRADGSVEPAVMERADHPMKPGQEIYALGGHTGLGSDELGNAKDANGNDIPGMSANPRRQIAGGPVVESYIVDRINDGIANNTSPTGFRTIALGKVFPDQTEPTDVWAGNTHVLGMNADMPNSPGMSGGLVAARDTHRVVGLHFSGMGPTTPTWTQSSVPIDAVRNLANESISDPKNDDIDRELLRQLGAP